MTEKLGMVVQLSGVLDGVAGGEIDINANVLQSIGIACIVGGFIALISFGQNVLEEKTHTTILPK